MGESAPPWRCSRPSNSGSCRIPRRGLPRIAEARRFSARRRWRAETIEGFEAMKRVTRDDGTKAVGRADDVTIAEINGTGATGEELAEAQARIAHAEPPNKAGRTR